eukprot:s3178_g2.t1
MLQQILSCPGVVVCHKADSAFGVSKAPLKQSKAPAIEKVTAFACNFGPKCFYYCTVLGCQNSLPLLCVLDCRLTGAKPYPGARASTERVVMLFRSASHIVQHGLVKQPVLAVHN